MEYLKCIKLCIMGILEGEEREKEYLKKYDWTLSRFDET